MSALSLHPDQAETTQLTKKDFESDQEVRWCPGCGDYSILAIVQRLLPTLGIPRENHVFVSGIGCSSRFPYYMNTYGFHTIHGRAPAIATGLKITRPELTVWVITGDGDALSIGGNHLLHLFRRNVNVNVLMFNNQIYGLTKGQYSPTSVLGKVTKSTPFGSLDEPANPLSIALGAKATFIARASALDAKSLSATLQRAVEHQGTSFVEIFQNCNVFNDGAFESFDERSVRSERQIQLTHGEPMVFGKERDKGIALDGLSPVVRENRNGNAQSLLVHDESNKMLAHLLAEMHFPEFPVPMGVIYREDRATYEKQVADQISAARAKRGEGDLAALLSSGDTWSIR